MRRSEERVHIDALTGVAIVILTNDYMALVDARFAEQVSQHSWSYALSTQYPKSRAGYLHRFIAKLAGWEPERIDHISTDRFDNRLCNLREVTQSQNLLNRKKRAGCSSRYVGVSWSKNRQVWESYIKDDTKKILLGFFRDEEEAAMARDTAARPLYGEYGRYNFPLPGEQSAI